MKLFTIAFMFGMEPVPWAKFQKCRIHLKGEGTSWNGALVCHKLPVLATSVEDAKRNLIEMVQAFGGTVRRTWLLRTDPAPQVRIAE